MLTYISKTKLHCEAVGFVSEKSPTYRMPCFVRTTTASRTKPTFVKMAKNRAATAKDRSNWQNADLRCAAEKFVARRGRRTFRSVLASGTEISGRSEKIGKYAPEITDPTGHHQRGALPIEGSQK